MTTARTAPHRLLAVLLAAALAFIALPVTAAFAAPTGTVSRTSPMSVFPSESQKFRFSVTNNGAALVGEAINWVRFVLPSDEAGVVHNKAAFEATDVPAGWTVTREGLLEDGSPDRGAIQTVTYRTSSSTSVLRPGATLAFAFPAQIDRPLNSDRTGTFTVAASSDSGRTTKGLTGAPTALDVNVKVLEVLELGATAPAGVVDQTGTAGQAGITYAYKVKNYAQNSLSVAGTLVSNGDDSIGAGTGTTVDGVGGNTFAAGSEKAGTVSHQVTLGSVGTADRTATFTATATAPGATSAPAARGFVVQVPADLALSNLQPKRVRTVNNQDAVTFTADARKTGSPALTVSSGKLSIAVPGLSPVVIDLAKTPVAFGTGTVDKQVEFVPTVLSGTVLNTLLRQEIAAAATATVTSADENGFDFVKGKNVLVDTINIDNLAPELTVRVTLPTDADGRQQTAARNTNRIQVDGTIAGLDAAPTTVGTGPRRLTVTISDGKSDFNVPVTVSSAGGTNYTFTGSATPSYDAAAKTATVKATVTDTAGNLGTSPVANYIIDNVLPELDGPGRTTTTRSIVVRFFDDNSDLLGGCDPQHYLVGGVPGLVERVEFTGNNPTGGNGMQCPEATAAPGNSGTRVLILRSAMAEDATPQVTYNAAARTVGADPVKDGAANEALRKTIDTIRQIAPLAPEIVRVTRAQGAETATRVDAQNAPSTYHTRFNKVPGTTTDDLEVRFLGSRNNYQVQVIEVDAAGKPVLVNGKEKDPLATKAVTGPATPLDANEQSIRVPLGETDGLYRRAIRFITTSGTGSNASTVIGELTLFNVELDRVAPAIKSRTASGNEVTVEFEEVIHSGGEFASDWFGLATTSSGATRAYQAESVATPGNNMKKLAVPFPGGTTFAGIEYRYTSGPDGGLPVVDRAGNRLLNQRK